MPHHKNNDWLPKAKRYKQKDGTELLEDNGDCITMALTRHPNDDFLTACVFSICCDCTLTHLHAYEVRKHKGQYYLIRRGYRVAKKGRLE